MVIYKFIKCVTYPFYILHRKMIHKINTIEANKKCEEYLNNN